MEREEGRFVHREGDAVAELVYEVEGDRLLIIHTGVPDTMAGQGVGGALVRAAVTWAADSGLTVVPWCPFARRWLQEHPGAASSVDVDWDTLPLR